MREKVILGDCFENLSKIEDNSIDLIAIDPPYEISYENLEWDKKSLNWNILRDEFYRILNVTGKVSDLQKISVCFTQTAVSIFHTILSLKIILIS